MINEEAIPQELKDKRQWVCWHYETRDGKKTKIPIDAKTGKPASTTNPKTWCTFEHAVGSAKDKGAGIGFVFNDDFIGIDIDHAIIPGADTWKPWAEELLRTIGADGTYSEKSPSLEGVHIIMRGRLPGKGCKKAIEDGAIEMYSHGRYFTFTGDSLTDPPASIADQSAAIIELYKTITNGNGNGTGKKQNQPAAHFTPDDEYAQRLEAALRDPVFSRLWNGDTSGNNDDDSAADLALANKIAFYFGTDVSRVDSVFRQSRLMRDKWNRDDYRTWTINKAISSVTETYSPKRKPAKTGHATSQPESRTKPINDSGEENSKTQHAEPEKDMDTGMLANLNNAVRIIESDPDFCAVWYDDFQQRVLTDDPAREWADHDDIRLTVRFQREKGIPRMSLETVRAAVTDIAFRHRKNCVRDWLDSLKWDGVQRLENFFPDFYGAPATAYTLAAGKNFLIGMVARIYKPGCQLDTLPVLEGAQGILKSSSLRALAGDYHTEQHESVLSKDFYQNLQGKWLIEISEFSSFGRAETSKVKQVVSNPNDRYRPSYGRRSVDHPRQCVFVATCNRDDWNSDVTGARRFHPIVCSEIDLLGIRSHREKLFAEAVTRFKAGDDWWKMPDAETVAEQQLRYVEDVWTDMVEEFIRTKTQVTVPEIMKDCLKFEVAKMDKRSQMRVADTLRALGWGRGERIRNPDDWTKRVYFWSPK